LEVVLAGGTGAQQGVSSADNAGSSSRTWTGRSSSTALNAVAAAEAGNHFMFG
jgi:hypothetical protein